MSSPGPMILAIGGPMGVAIGKRTEKVRQQIMRFNELLGLMRGKLADGERAYNSLFVGFTPDEVATMKHKDLQWKLAERMDTLTPLKQAVFEMHFDARELEKALAELCDIIAMTPDAMD